MPRFAMPHPFRLAAVTVLGLSVLSACSPRQDAKPAAVEAPPANPAPAAVTTAPDPAAARAVAVRYFALLDKADYGAALALWNAAGQTSFRGDPKLLAEQYAPFTRFHATAAPVEAAYGGTDPNYMVVPATAEVTLRSDGSTRKLAGRVYLHRAPDGAWKIDGVDIRKPATTARRPKA